jgi:hypothetical protein
MRDPQDTMILQVSGHKYWRVYRPTRSHPFYPSIDDFEMVTQPTEAPVWDGNLEDGDMLYIPRGWWHVAAPLDEPSLHLTVTIVPPNGVDLLQWFTRQLTRQTEVRMNVPNLASVADRKQYVSRLRELLVEFCRDDILENFLADWEAKIPLRPHVQLPHAPMEQSAPITMETHVRLATTRRLVFDKPAENAPIRFVALDIRGDCAPDLVPALRELSGTVSRSVRELCSQLPEHGATHRLIVLLTALAMRGVLLIENPEADRSTG